MGTTFEPCWEDALKDFLEHIKSCRAPKTHTFYRTQLGQLYDWATEHGVGLVDFSARHMRQYVNARADKGLSPATVHLDKITARAFFSFARQEGYIKGRPLQTLDMRKPPRMERYCPTDDEVCRILAQIPQKWRTASNPGILSLTPNQRAFFSRRDRAIVSGLISTGCRLGELLALDLADVDLHRGEIVIRQSKGRKPRHVLFGRWGSELAAWLEIRPHVETPLVFISNTGERVSVTWMSKKIGDYCRSVAPNITAHSLRHYAATKLALVSPAAAQQLLGHASLQTTMGYVHAVSEDIRAAYAMADPLGRALGQRKVQEKKRRII